MPETGFPFWPPGPWFTQQAPFQGQDAVGTDHIDAPFIASVTQVFTPTLTAPSSLSQLAVEVLEAGNPAARISQTAVEVLRTYTGTAVNAGVSQVAIEVLGATPPSTIDAPFISSRTVVYGVFSVFDSSTRLGPGNGGEIFGIDLAPVGTSVVATLTAPLSTEAVLHLSGDSGLPSVNGFCLTIDSETIYVKQISLGLYRIVYRALSNTTFASHSSGASAIWSDHYDQAILATNTIGSSFTANIAGTGSTTYNGFLIAFDSTQAYLGANRYPMHVTSFLGVFDAGAGSGGTNRCDAAQPNSICTPAALSDNCPAALSRPSRMTSNIAVGDVGLVRYTNPEASIMTLGSRSVALNSWFGLYRVDSSNADVTATDVNGNIVDGTINGEFLNPSSVGISPTTGTPTTTAVPWTTVTLPGSSRTFTHGGTPSPPNFNDKGWPICCLAVRQGIRRVPHWASYDWHDFNYVFTGFAIDATFAQMVVNRNGNLSFTPLPSVALPGPQDIDGPNAVWDDGSYYFGASWYVALYITPYPVIGPSIGGGTSGTFNPNNAPVPQVDFTGGAGSPTVTVPPNPIEGGSGGGIIPTRASRFDAKLT